MRNIPTFDEERGANLTPFRVTCHSALFDPTMSSESNISIHLLSDLHLEIDRGGGPDYETFRITPKSDILALLGDIGTLNEDRLFRFLRQQTLQFSRVLYVPGNHEFYHQLRKDIKLLNRCVLTHFFIALGRCNPKTGCICITM